MKSLKKIIALMLCLLTVLAAVSCNSSVGNEESDGSETLGDTEKPSDGGGVETTDVPKPQYEIELVSDGKSDYCISVPSDADDTVTKAAQGLKEKIKTYTGAELAIEFDSKNDKRISFVLGDESSADELIRGLRANDWVFAVREKEIIIGGGTSATIENPVRHFLDKVIYAQGKKNGTAKSVVARTANDKEFRYNYAVAANYSVANVPLMDYNIVYAKDDLYAYHNAVLLRELIYERYGYYLMTYDDSYPEVKNEILVGMTSRTQATVKDFEFALNVRNGKLEVAFKRMHAKEAVYDYFSSVLLARGAQDLSEGYTLKQDISSSLTNGAEMVLGNTGNVRLIISNIQAAGENAAKRMEMLSMVFDEYAPDAIALQEAGNKNVRVDTPNIFTMMEEYGYKEVAASGLGSNINYTPILYNTNTLELLHSGWHLYSGPNNSNSKSITWAHFKNKDGKEFVFFSTHFMYNADGLTAEQGEETRKNNARELSELASELSTLYGCPVFGGGDMNCTVDSAPYNVLMENGFKNARFTAEKIDDEKGTCSVESVLNKNYDTFISLPNKSVIMAGEIDMLFGYGNGYTFKQQNVMTDRFALYASDHVPVMVDVLLK